MAADVEPWIRAFLVTLGALAMFVQPGPFLNDEVGQIAALHSLARGELLVQSDLPEGFETWRYWGGNVVPEPGEPPRANDGSTMTTVLALPALAVLRGLAVPLGPMGAVGLLVAAAVGAGVWASCKPPGPSGRAGDAPGTGQAASPPAPATGRAMWQTVWGLLAAWPPWGLPLMAGGLLLAGALVMQAWSRPPAAPYLEAAALQFVSLGLHAFATALVYDLLRTRVGSPGLGTALYAFGTPALFWGLNLKYHGVAVCLAAVVLWLYQEGHRTRPGRTALAFAVAGLAVWNHLPNGGIVLVSLTVMALPAVALGLFPMLRRAGAGAAGVAVGLLPEAVDRTIHNAMAVRDRFIQVGGGEEVGDQLRRQSEGGRLQWTAWNDPSGPFDALWQLVFWSDPATPELGHALPLLALVPLAALLWWGFRQGRSPAWAPMLWMVVHLVLLLVLFGRGLFRNGDSFDLRHSTTLYPFLALPLALVAQHARVRLVLQAGTAIVAVLAVAVWLPFHMARRMKGYSALEQGVLSDLIDPFRYGGLLLALALLIVWLVPRLRVWRPHAVAAGVAWSILLQVTLQLGPARTAGGMHPFVAWPTAMLEWIVEQWVYPV